MVPCNGWSSDILSISRNARANSSSQSMALFPAVILADSPFPLPLVDVCPIAGVPAHPLPLHGVLDSPGSPGGGEQTICIGKSRGLFDVVAHRIASRGMQCMQTGSRLPPGTENGEKKPRGTIAGRDNAK